MTKIYWVHSLLVPAKKNFVPLSLTYIHFRTVRRGVCLYLRIAYHHWIRRFKEIKMGNCFQSNKIRFPFKAQQISFTCSPDMPTRRYLFQVLQAHRHISVFAILWSVGRIFCLRCHKALHTITVWHRNTEPHLTLTYLCGPIHSTYCSVTSVNL